MVLFRPPSGQTAPRARFRRGTRADTLARVTSHRASMASDSNRREALNRFVSQTLTGDFAIEVASADASFRSYWRALPRDGGATFIVMDAPPDKENLEPWLDVGARLHKAGLHSPEVLA